MVNIQTLRRTAWNKKTMGFILAIFFDNYYYNNELYYNLEH